MARATVRGLSAKACASAVCVARPYRAQRARHRLRPTLSSTACAAIGWGEQEVDEVLAVAEQAQAAAEGQALARQEGEGGRWGGVLRGGLGVNH